MKVNENGRPCAPWCAKDHEGDDAAVSCMGVDREVMANRAGILGKGAVAGTYARHAPWDKRPELVVWTWGKGASATSGYAHAPSRYEAGELARFLDLLSELSPAGIRQLAATVRKVAAAAYPEEEASGD
jgi:hypothetical protein